MSSAKGLRLFYLFLAIHLGLVVGIFFVANTRPIRNFSMISSDQGIYLAGTNIVGLQTFIEFEDWLAFHEYIEAHHLSLPKLSYAEQGGAVDVQTRYINAKGRNFFRVQWKAGLGNDLQSAIDTPDSLAAAQISEYVQYYGLRPSSLGFSLPLE